MKSGFKDPIAIKNQKPEFKPMDGKNSAIDFRCMPYDQRSSCFVKAGTDYGVGHKQPVGSKGNPSERAECLPFGRVETMKVKGY